MFLLESIVYWQHLLPRHSWITVIWPIVFRRRSVGTEHWNNKDRAVYSERTTMSENWVLQHQVIWSYCTVFHTHRKINDSSSAFTQKKTGWKGWSGRVEIINSILFSWQAGSLLSRLLQENVDHFLQDQEGSCFRPVWLSHKPPFLLEERT